MVALQLIQWQHQLHGDCHHTIHSANTSNARVRVNSLSAANVAAVDSANGTQPLALLEQVTSNHRSTRRVLSAYHMLYAMLWSMINSYRVHQLPCVW